MPSTQWPHNVPACPHTGYKYVFPFLESAPPSPSQPSHSDTQPPHPAAQPAQQGTSSKGVVSEGHLPQQPGLPNEVVATEGRFVRPLYHHIFPPAAAPWLSFVGLPWKVIPFPQFELQAKLIAR